MEGIVVSLPEVVSRLTMGIKITGAREARFRMWLAKPVFGLAAAVLGCKCKVEISAGLSGRSRWS